MNTIADQKSAFMNFSTGVLGATTQIGMKVRPRVLLVDDEPRLLSSLCELLKPRDYQLATAACGREALDHLSQGEFDLVILDMRLPDMGGHEIMDFINASNAGTDVIVISGNNDIDSAIGALKRGAFDYLRKPYAREELLKTVDNALRQRALEADNRRVTWQLENSEKTYRYLVDNSPDIIYTLDDDGLFTFVNDRAQQLLGFTREELIGKHYSVLVHDDDIALARYVFNERRVGKRASNNVELRLKCHNGCCENRTFENSLLTISFNSMGMYSPNGKESSSEFFGTYGVARDITERKRADRFKSLNDTLGHDYGDMLLIEVAVRIKSCVREMDTVARLGGDEFVVLIEGVSESEEDASYKVELVAEKIRETLARPYQLRKHEHQSSPSIGISLYFGAKESVEVLLQHADMAMYQAKKSGRNAVRFFDPIMQHDVEEHVTLENDLRHAIAQQELHLHYQIQVDNDHQPVGAEALLRWLHPQRGLVMPDLFIPLAEKSTLILEIGYWVLETACRQLALWGADEQRRDLTLTVNISAKQFVQPDFVDIVTSFLSNHEINPARLELEITESTVLDNLDSTVEKMHALKALGINLSMEDFGTRYSSLSYLKRLPLDQLKLGRDFVQTITRNRDDALLVQNIISLANNSRMNVIAEGVETEDQLSLLKHRDCIAYQGFLFSKAVSVGEFEALLGRGV